MKRRCLLLALSTAVIMLHQETPARAIDFERLMMPGPVSSAHAETEDDCSRCHSPFDTGREATLCIACHEEEGEDRKTGQGFHGRNTGARDLTCRACHTEHKGRTHDILGLDLSVFDHAETDFPLQGAHVVATCTGCHPDDGETKRRDAPGDCLSCHEKDDAHRGELGNFCSDCHVEESWKKARFDHSKTKFALEGAHETVACSRCHAGNEYKETPKTCIGCHQLDDVHQGRFGNDCAKCHDETSFKKSQRFDHTKETKFPLRGRHKKIGCEQCHVEPAEKVELATECKSCHLAVDTHRGLFGTKCEECHRETRWDESKFSHDRATRFPLDGQHKKTACETCHPTTPKEEPQLASCETCHRHDDVHQEQLGEHCARCHDAASWSQRVFFEHDLTRFPLLGMHAALACDDCHTTMKFKDTKIACAACHESEDVHEATLGVECAQCHNPNAWPVWRFDHDRETRFALERAHEGLACEACHTTSNRSGVRTSSTCESCHMRDDVHRGRFGKRCDACHDGTEWKKARMPR